MKKKIYQVIAILLSLIILLTNSLSLVKTAKAGHYNQLGSNTALGSPILNDNFTAEDWNKWEIYCWGIFLSNFCMPLVDTYESAFQKTGTGSNGSGFQALQFGAGTSADSSQIIEEFCSYAIAQQKASKRDIYVTYSDVSNYGTEGKCTVNSVDPNTATGTDFVRVAAFQDLFFTKDKCNNSITDDVMNVKTTLETSHNDMTYYHDVNIVRTAKVPTLWVKTNSGTYVKIWDMLDSWDAQIVASMTSKISNMEMADAFYSSFDSHWNTNDAIKLDVFGNIVFADGTVVIPASTNQHLTKERKLNLVNSFVLNSNTKSYSSSQLANEIEQYRNLIFAGLTYFDSTTGNVPALSGKDSILKDGSCYIYYDLDTIGAAEVSTDYGSLVEKLFSCNLNNKVNSYKPTIEVVNKVDTNFWGTATGYSSSNDILTHNQIVTYSLTNALAGVSDSNASILTEITMINGDKLKLFDSNPIVVPVGLLPGNKKQDDNAANLRKLWNFLYLGYTNNITQTTAGGINNNTVKSLLTKSNSISRLADNIESEGIIDKFKSYYNINTKVKLKDAFDVYENEQFHKNSSRLILLYPTSTVMKNVSNILGVVEGTEFSVYSAYIYATYLDWYGVTMKSVLTGGTEPTSYLNPDIFNDTLDPSNFDPTDVINMKSEESLERELMEYSYLMLSPTAGRSYRTEMASGFMSDFLYKTYTSIVYGSVGSGSGGVTTKSSDGFLKIPTLEENFMTSWFINKCTTISVILIMIMLIVMIMHGLYKSRKPIWFILNAFLIVNIVLITPSTGELVPYITSKAINSMFSGKMTFWSISEAVSNAALEKDAVSKDGLEGLNEEEALQVAKLVNSLNTLYLDRSLSIKKDISSKTIQEVGGVYTEIQQLKSARWLLPTIMEQYTSGESADDYVYVTLGNLFDDMSNYYWYYNPVDAENTNALSETLTSGQVDAPNAGDVKDIYNNVQSSFGDFYDLSTDDDTYEISYQSNAYKVNESEPSKLIHTYSYMLDNVSIESRSITFGNDLANYEDSESYNEYAETLKTNSVDLKEIEKHIEEVADSYDRTSRDTFDQSLGYLWATETPVNWFYQNIKESFESSMSYGALIGRLQGKYKENKVGEEVRSSFMHADETYNNTEYPTGYVKDVCDLQGMFYNHLPYMYQTMMLAGGTDGEHGVFEGDNITKEYAIYEGQNKSWLFRCNWAVKIMECPEHNKEMIVKDSAGAKYVVKNPMLPESYPSNRPMVFSEAQMHALGLDESALNVIELKCLQVNQKVVDSWTLLINYAGTGGMTLEILERQMALDSMLIFNEVFSPSTAFNSAFEMYPQTIDLRNISFDSIMKMLILNASNDTSYIYGSTMQTLIENTDIFTSILLLCVAFVCAKLVPMMQQATMGGVFFIGYIAMIRNLVATEKFKAKAACGQALVNTQFTIFTVAYYWIFSWLVNVNSADEVLTTNGIRMKIQSPTWVLILVLILSIIYLLLVFGCFAVVWNDIGSMGLDTMKAMANHVTHGVNEGLRKVRGSVGAINTGIRNLDSGMKSFRESVSNYANDVYTDNRSQSNIADNSRRTSNSSRTTNNNKTSNRSYNSSNNTYNHTVNNESDGSREIDETIRRGAKMGDSGDSGGGQNRNSGNHDGSRRTSGQSGYSNSKPAVNKTNSNNNKTNIKGIDNPLT